MFMTNECSHETCRFDEFRSICSLPRLPWKGKCILNSLHHLWDGHRLNIILSGRVRFLFMASLLCSKLIDLGMNFTVSKIQFKWPLFSLHHLHSLHLLRFQIRHSISGISGFLFTIRKLGHHQVNFSPMTWTCFSQRNWIAIPWGEASLWGYFICLMEEKWQKR